MPSIMVGSAQLLWAISTAIQLFQKAMKRTPNVILFILRSTTEFVHSTANHHKMANKISVQEDDIHGSRLSKLVDRQMQSYPISSNKYSIKLDPDDKLSRHKKTKGTQLMKYVYEFSNRSSYLLLEETKALLSSMDESEVIENEVNLEMLKKSVFECMTRQELAEHASSEIQILLSQITELQLRKSGKMMRD